MTRLSPAAADSPKAALLLFSGGQDSAICLAWALERFDRVETVGFEYGQRHNVEMACRLDVRRKIAAQNPHWREKLREDHVLDIKALGEISDTALTRTREIEMQADGLPSTFVPGRNIIFLSFAAALAWRRNTGHIVAGICESDYSGYPDCREDFFRAMQVTLNLGMETGFRLHAPLMDETKAQSWALAEKLGGKKLVETIRVHSHSCYLGERGKRHAWGYGCGVCPACRLRARGWKEYAEKSGKETGL